MVCMNNTISWPGESESHQVIYPQPTEAALHFLKTYKHLTTDRSIKLQVHLQDKISIDARNWYCISKMCSVGKFSSPTFPPIVQLELALYAWQPVDSMIKNIITFRPVML